MTSELTAQIDSLLHLDAKGVLVPHGIGGLARQLLEACKIELNTRAAPEVPELVRYNLDRHDNGMPAPLLCVSANGAYVRHDQAAAVIAAKDAEIERLKQRETKLAQIKDQKPVGVISKVKMSSLAGLVCNIFNPLDGDFEVPDGLKLYAAPVASEAETIECIKWRDAALGAVTAWEALPGGKNYYLSEVAKWVQGPMYKAITAIRALSGKEPS